MDPMRALLIAALLCVPALADAAAPAKNRVAVLYFDYDGKDEGLTALRKGLAQMLVVDLAQQDQFEVVEREKLQEVVEEQKLQHTTKFDQATVVRLGKLLGATHQVFGAYFTLGADFVVSARVVDAELGKTVGGCTSKQVAKPADFLAMETKIAEDLGKCLAKLLPPKTGEATPRQAPARPKKLALQTAVKYGRALDALDRKDTEAAKKQLEAVVVEQPDFALGASQLAALMR